MTTDWCDASGVSIHYELVGKGDCTLVFIHELGGSLFSWDALVDRFAGQFRCLRYDQRGAGGSEKVRSAFTVEDHVDDLNALVRFLNLSGPFVLVSLAAGATVALAFAHRYSTAVAALVLCAPATGVSAERREYLETRSYLALEQGMRAVTKDSLARSYPPAAVRDAAVYRRYCGRFMANDPLGYACANRALAQFDLDAFIGGAERPCLLLSGVHDVLRPYQEVKQLARRLSSATLVEIDAGHLMSVQHPAAVAAAIDQFLLELGLAPMLQNGDPR